MMVRRVPIAEIQKSPMNPRQVMSRERIEALATSIRQIGVAQPLVLWLNRRAWRYEAAKMAGLTEVPALVYEVGPEEAMKIAFSIHLS